ncbi:E3 ubiquitin-protein ligase [Quillaja saponaria]|uniref:E3 ubiquitin-protein ligase RMA n=1 Tax=Quillaja saponaria TaxID=32244 RepID=A0AAD7PW81_QUISA|nr:E3 ubiquitin-protein ligase [Quillaja saponaria]
MDRAQQERTFANSGTTMPIDPNPNSQFPCICFPQSFPPVNININMHPSPNFYNPNSLHPTVNPCLPNYIPSYFPSNPQTPSFNPTSNHQFFPRPQNFPPNLPPPPPPPPPPSPTSFPPIPNQSLPRSPPSFPPNPLPSPFSQTRNRSLPRTPASTPNPSPPTLPPTSTLRQTHDVSNDCHQSFSPVLHLSDDWDNYHHSSLSNYSLSPSYQPLSPYYRPGSPSYSPTSLYTARNPHYSTPSPEQYYSPTTPDYVPTSPFSSNPRNTLDVPVNFEELMATGSHRSVGATTTTPHEKAMVFQCNICLEIAEEPVVTMCGHLYCWPCLHKWSGYKLWTNIKCPVCKDKIVESMIIPIYGQKDINKRELASSSIPPRPSKRCRLMNNQASFAEL